MELIERIARDETLSRIGKLGAAGGIRLDPWSLLCLAPSSFCGCASAPTSGFGVTAFNILLLFRILKAPVEHWPGRVFIPSFEYYLAVVEAQIKKEDKQKGSEQEHETPGRPSRSLLRIHPLLSG